MFNKRLFIIICLFFSTYTHAQVDLSGNWNNGSGIDFVKPEVIGDSICVFSCPELEGKTGSVPVPRAAPSRPSYKTRFQAKVDDLNLRQVETDPVLRCQPPGLPRIGPPDKIIQTSSEIVFLYDDVSGNYFRVIPIDGRGHRDDVERSFFGDSIGYWENLTLVVKTTNFNDKTWLTDDGSFHTEQLKVMERITRTGDELHWQAIVHDPEVLAEPWTLPVRTAFLTETGIVEASLCIERDLEHIVDGSHHDNVR